MKGSTKKFLSAAAAVFILIFSLALLNRTGSLILFWKEEPIGSITHDDGFGYYTWVQDENISRLSLPFFLKEDGISLPAVPLSVNEDITASIKEEGGGTWQMLANNDLYFSASDNRVEEHEYSIISPIVIRNRYLLILCLPALLGGAFALIRQLRFSDSLPFRYILRTLTVVGFLLLLLPWNRLIFSALPIHIGSLLFKPILQRNAVFLGLLLILLLFRALLSEKSTFICVLSVLIILTNTAMYFLPEWDWYGRRADSGAYLQHYTPSSIRTPGYPAFIEAVYSLSGNDGLEDIRQEDESMPDERLLDGTVEDSHGLLAVTRAQKCVLGVSFLILSAVFCIFYSPVWFASAAQLILCGGFLGVDNSYIMTECLSQAVILLVTAMLVLIIKKQSAASFILICVFAAAGILIRPANIFLCLPILIGGAVLLFRKGFLLILPLGILAFAALAAIPAFSIYRQYRIFVWMPSSGYVEIARAAALLQPGDEELFDDPEARQFTMALLEKKDMLGDADQNTYMWDAAVAAAEELGYDRITCSPIFGKVSRKIFMQHSGEFFSSLAETIETALDRTRLRIGPIPFQTLLILFTILFLFRVNADSLTGMGLVLMHAAHLCISMVNQAERRYIYSTEILCLLGWLLIVINLSKRKGAKRKDAQLPYHGE